MCSQFYFAVRPRTPVILNSSPSTATIQGIEGLNLILTCISTGGYPQQTVKWYRGSVTDANRLAENTWAAFGELFNVTSTYTFVPKNTDDGFKFFCQSSYSGDPRIEDTSNVTLTLARK